VYEEADAMSSSLASETPVLLPQPATILYSCFTNIRDPRKDQFYGCNIIERQRCIIFKIIFYLTVKKMQTCFQKGCTKWTDGFTVCFN
jgi:hypothetical protein